MKYVSISTVIAFHDFVISWSMANSLNLFQERTWDLCNIYNGALVKIIKDSWNPLTIVTTSSTLNVAGIHNDSINLIKNAGEGNWFSVFLMMFPKHVHIDRNLQWRLKSSMSFILKHIFIYILSCLSTFKNLIRFHPINSIHQG